MSGVWMIVVGLVGSVASWAARGTVAGTLATLADAVASQLGELQPKRRRRK